MKAVVITQKVEFELKPWVIRDNDKAVHPEGGTWTLLPISLVEQTGHRALISCPRCEAAYLLPRSLQEESANENLECEFHCDQCKFNCQAILLDWFRKKLYCIAYELHESVTSISIEKEYCHAETRQDALYQFWGTKGTVIKPKIRIIEVGRVFGYFSQDKNGIRLEVEPSEKTLQT